MTALLTVALSVPLYRGWVGMNKVYGIRIPPAFRSPEDWQRVNRLGGKLGIICGVVYGLIAGVFVAAPPTTPWANQVLGLSPLAMIAVWLGLTIYATRRL
ncbi:MAG: SdpI family protein [Thermoanaerobaculia bacterium]